MMMTCSECDYGVAIEGDADGILECRRHAISAVGIDEDGNVLSAFPGCEPYMWCGDFVKKPKLGDPSSYAQEW